jgi:drug/metabolite transporter (DMT)-like permease
VDASLGVLAGILAAVGWGFSDFLAKIAVDRIGRNGDAIALLWARAIGVVLLCAALLSLPGIVPAGVYSIPLAELLPLLAALGVMDFLGSLMFFRAMGKGEVAIVSPVAASYSAVAALTGFAFLGEAIGAPRAVGIGLTLGGVALMSGDARKLLRGGSELGAGIPEAAFTMLCWGAMWAVLGTYSAALGWAVPLLAMRIVTVALAACCAAPMRARGLLVSAPVLAVIAASSAADVGAAAIAIGGLAGAPLSTVIPLSSAFPAVTVVLAVAFLKEKLEPNHALGIAAIVLGVLLIAL